MGKLIFIFLFYTIPSLVPGIYSAFPWNNTTAPSTYLEVPTFKINFYLMGKSEVCDSTIANIEANLEYLDTEFEDKIKFKPDYYLFDGQSAYLPDIHLALLKGEDDWVTDIVSSVEIKGRLNVFVFDTYTPANSNQSLMGFTPILRDKQEDYGAISPEFDRMYIAYESLLKKTTLVHEIGHFLGLQHPWEMSMHSKQQFGLVKQTDQDDNHMSYHHDVHKFTTQQIEHMRLFALEYRSYLLEEINWIAFND